MLRRTLLFLATLVSMLFPLLQEAIGPRIYPQSPAGEAATARTPLIELLPGSTVFAAEIRGLAARWSEVRAIPTIARIQDFALDRLRIAPEDLPRLAGDRAVIALVPTDDGRSMFPVALLRPREKGRAVRLLKTEPSLSVARGRDALWVGPAHAGHRVRALAQGDGSHFTDLAAVSEARRRLPNRGLVRGYINPAALSDLIRAQVPGTLPAPLELAGSLIAAELDAIRAIGFYRDIVPSEHGAGELVTELVEVYDTDLLPDVVARTLNPGLEAPHLPEHAVTEAAFAAAFRPEPQAWLPWLHHVAAGDPRGPLRNLDFWIDEFEERTKRDLENDLLGALGEHAWLLALEAGPEETTPVVLVLEATDAVTVEEVLLELRSWSAEQIWGRGFGFTQPRVHDRALGMHTVHGIDLWTPLGELSGPAFIVTDRHLLIGTGEQALLAGLRLVDKLAEPSGTRDRAALPPSQPSIAAAVARDEMELDPVAHVTIRARGSLLARSIEALLAPTLRESEAFGVFDASDLLSEIGEIAARVEYERDAIRLRGRVMLNDRRSD